ncbi:uncharacterized protein ColSpa_07478 [Colletotrichum spaethianum]|uniref:Uncharacterized protein n=1 Tax=Colletotrichum spaethianum TaxID=700344 RepID=A0AA37LIS3_9PEZI|nr:uncharacterized protein ColSpa_07478 [Colletotrichum spaethianum]GKT47298.1 hypothetical protein ColSpa_07478 [Colletotrichum spaethianum]
MEDAVAIGQLLDGSLGDVGCVCQQRLVAGGLAELDEPAENDTLVAERPPAFVVIKLVDEVGEALSAELAGLERQGVFALGDGIGRCHKASRVDGLGSRCCGLLGLVERVAENASNVELVGGIAVQDGKVGERRKGVGAVPPRVVPKTCANIVPRVLKRLDGADGIVGVGLNVCSLGDGTSRHNEDCTGSKPPDIGYHLGNY